MAKRMRDVGITPSRSPSPSPSPRQSKKEQEPSLSRSESSDTIDQNAGPELENFFGPLGSFSVGTTRPDAISPIRPRKKSCQRPIIVSDEAASIPVLQIYLNVSGNLQPGAAAMKDYLKGKLIPFVPAMIDQTLKRPNIFFMPTTKLTTKGLKAEGSEPMQVLDSASYYNTFLNNSAPTDPCEPTRPKLFDNVKHNLEYIKNLYLPVGGKIMLPQMLSGREGVQGYELYQIDSVSLQPLELPASAGVLDTRQTVISELQIRLRENEEIYEEANRVLEAAKNNDGGHTQTVTQLDAKLAEQNADMERVNSRVKINNELVRKLLEQLTKQQSTNETRIEGLQAAIQQLAVKFPEPRDPLQESRYVRENDSLQARLNGLSALQSNYKYYLDKNDGINWSDDSFTHRQRATQTMKDYTEAKKVKSNLNKERKAIINRANTIKEQIRNANLEQSTHIERVNAAETRMKNTRTELFKSQEQLNAAKGGWLIDRVPGSGGKWWVVTKNGFAFPRVYNALFDIRVSYIGDEGEGADRFWGLDCAGKADSLDRHISELIGRNPNAPFNVFKEFIQAYEPPWSPFASPAAFTSEGRRTAQTPETKAQLAQARQAVQRDDVYSRAIRANMNQRLGAATGHARPLTLNELRAYGVAPAPLPSAALSNQALGSLNIQGIPAPPIQAPNTQGIGVPATQSPIAQTLFSTAPPPPQAQPLFQASAPPTFPPTMAPQDPFAQSPVPVPEEPTFFNRPYLPQSSTPQPESIASRIGLRSTRGKRKTQGTLGTMGGGRKTRRRKGSNQISHRRRQSRRKPSTKSSGI